MADALQCSSLIAFQRHCRDCPICGNTGYYLEHIFELCDIGEAMLPPQIAADFRMWNAERSARLL